VSSPVEQVKPARQEIAVSDGISDQTSAVIAVPTPPGSTALVCADCGAASSPGKRFCRRCGHAIDTAVPTANSAPSAVEQAEPETSDANVSLFETESVTAPLLDPVAHDQTIPAAVDSAPSGIAADPLLQAEPGTTSNEDGFEHNSLETQNLSMDEGNSQPLFKFSGVEEESTASPQFQADAAAHEHDSTNSLRDARVDSDEETVLNPGDSVVRRRRILFLIIGAVCTAAALGAVAFIATYHWAHRPAPIAMQSTPPVAQAMPTVDQPSKSPTPTNADAPVAPTKPVLKKQEPNGHEAPARSAPPTKPISTNSHQVLQKSQGSSCALDSDMLSKMLNQADRNREQGNYPDAARQYRSVLDCDHNNARARSGLDLTLLDIQHQ
jgi:hypothetical protein